MDVTASTIRNVEFRERLRGYHQGDVDDFLEEVAAAVELMEDQLGRAERQLDAALPPAAVAGPQLPVAAVDDELLAPEAGSAARLPAGDEPFRRTFELAQRAAELAVREANEQGAAIVASAEAEAHALLTDAQERARALADAAHAHIRAEVVRLETQRDELRADVDRLTRLVERERSRAQAWLAQLVAAVEKPLDAGVVRSGPEEDGPPPAEAWDR